MAAPLGDRTRLDAAVDAAVAVAAVADEVSDRVGAIAFEREVTRPVAAPRGGPVVAALFDLEPCAPTATTSGRSRRVGESKRAFVLVLTDLLEEAAARPLLEAIPMLARRHAVVVASATDVDLEGLVTPSPSGGTSTGPRSPSTCSAARAREVARLPRAGATSSRRRPTPCAGACVGAYLRAKSPDSDLGAARARGRASSRAPRARRRSRRPVEPEPDGVR